MTPAKRIAKRLRARLTPSLAKRIRFVGIDVDGVMTDGGIYLGDAGGKRLEFKRFDIQDGLGIKMLQRAGIVTAILTGRVSAAVDLRAEELGVSEVIQDWQARKLPAFSEMLARHGSSFHEAAFIGDDLPDLSIMRVVALPVAVANASLDAKRAAVLTLSKRGGQGAVREFAEILLRARGQWDSLVEEYVQARSVPVPS